MYADQESAPRRIKPSPWVKVEAADSIASAATSAVVADVEIRKRPKRATPHPPQTDDLILSPATAEIRGVITTLVCVKKAARAAGLESRPALMNPFIVVHWSNNHECIE